MGPRDWFETIKEVVKKIGNTGDTGGSQTAGTVMGKENAALEILESFQNGNLPIVKSIQYGTGTTVRGATTVNINTVNPQKAFIIINWARYTVSQYIQSFNTDSFTLATHSSMDDTTRFSWQVIEFY